MMNTFKTKIIGLVTVLVAGIASVAHAAVVTLDKMDLYKGNNDNNATTYTYSYDVVASGADTVLLAMVSGRDADGGTFSLTYDVGGANTVVNPLVTAYNSSGGAYTTIFGIELGTVSATDTVDISVSNLAGDFRSSMSLFQLSDATLSGALTATDLTNDPANDERVDTSISGISPGSFFLSGVGTANNSTNFNGGLSGSPSITSGTASGTGFQDEGAYVVAMLYTENVTTNTASHFADPSGSPDQGMASVAIAAIPEPGTLALVGLGLGSALLVALRRR